MEAASMLIGRWLRRRWHLWGALLLLVYFAYHGVHGSRGLLAWMDKTHELEAARSELATLDGELKLYAARIHSLQPDRADPDLLEEHLRQLGYIAKGEVMLLPPKSDERR
jgi:cell division protein FtsB